MDNEAGELAGLALDLDFAAVILDDAVGDGQSQSGALANVFGGKKRIEHAIDMLRPNTGTVIFERQVQPIGFIVPCVGRYAGLFHSSGNPDRSTASQRIERIEKEIDKHLL